MKGLYGIDLIVPTRFGPMVVRVPGWINFNILRARAIPIIKKKRRA